KKPALTSEDSTKAHHKDGEDSTWGPGGNHNLPFACPTNNQGSSMAESKSLEELKIQRTTAKRLFSRLTNHIRRTHMDMSVEELQDSFKRLTAEGSKVIDVNEELEATYITQCEAEGTPELMGQQRADVEKTEKECEQKLEEAKHLIRETLWTSYGERELTRALKSAEMECENVSSTQPDTPLEVYDFMLHHLEELVKKAKQAHQTWNRWAPPAERRDCDRRLMELETCLPKLVSGKAALIKAERIKRDADQAVVTVRNAAPVAAIKLKATALPKFTGSQREFYRWRKEWEALQKQGEPTGSMEVKKFQLLDSLDEKVAKDLRLSTYTSADEIFRVLENRYGNQATIAIEIIEELQAIPPVRSNQPRRIIELIHAVEKALYDLNELDKANAIKNLLVIKSIESKLPESLKKDWLTHAADPKNAVTHQNRFDKLLAYLQSQESIYEQLDQLRDIDPAKERTKFPTKYARTKFLWRDTEDAGIEDYAITRVNIGDKPAGCIAQVAMRETANLPSFSHFKEEKRVLEEDAYVDDILTSHNDLDHLRLLTANIEHILRAGGFYMKPWVYSSQSGREEAKRELPRSEAKTIILPNQLTEDDNKALGLGYTINDDKLHVMVAVNFSKKRRKMRLGQDLLREEVREQTPDPLTRRELLSQVSGLYDPLGLVTPVKLKGAILVRRAFQEAKAKYCLEDTWDAALSEGLREDAIKLLEEYADLKKLHFTRALTPPDPCAEPSAITFSDGSEHAYGAVMYLRWSCSHSVIVRLVESKAKLTPLDHKSDPVKAEMCGAVFAARLKTYFQRHCRIQVKKWYHFVDSQTVLGAIQRDSYGFQTFFANRVGEIQSSTDVQDWWWIPGSANIADVLTRGASPNALTEDSEWQSGPKLLQLPEDEWLKKSAREVAAQAREKVTTLQKKAFVAVLTRIHTNAAQDSVHVELRRPLAGVATQQLINERRFSNLRRLIGTVAWVWRVAKKFMRSKTRDQEKWEVVPSSGVLTVNERRDAFRDLCLAAQEGVNFPSTTTDRLVVYRDQTSGLLVCGGRIQTFKEDRKAVPLVPFQAWLSTLLAREAHSEGHDGVAGTLLRMRKKAWVVRGRIIAQKVVDQCIICKKAKARTCKQVMGDLPEERSNPAAPFEFTSVDLFGPYHVRDDVKKRVTMKVWGVVFCCMASRAIHVKPVLGEMYAYLRQQNKESLEEYSAKNETTWAWKILPADSPHRNGAAEAAVRVTKRALHTLGNVEALAFSEFLTALQLAANLANERPIDVRIQSREDCIDYITPNNLLLGRATQSGDFKTIDFTNYPFKRLKEVQTTVNNFWRSWSQLAGPNLFIR
ncbi:unnamed protein product, partial [Oreochromis niloticus]